MIATNNTMEKHITFVHEGKKPHKCTICDASFALKAGLKQHVSFAHEKKKTHKCISFAYI